MTDDELKRQVKSLLKDLFGLEAVGNPVTPY